MNSALPRITSDIGICSPSFLLWATIWKVVLTTDSTAVGGRPRPTLGKFLIAALITGLGLAAAGLVLTGKPKPTASPPAEPLRPVVSVLEVEPEAISLPVVTQGTVEARRRISLVAQVAGKVESVADGFVEGAFFDAGDVLLEVEQADYQFAIARAESQLAAAQQRLAEERGRNRQAEREWRELGSVEANDLFLRKPQMRAAQAALAAARADLAEAELALARTQIRAPFAGRIEVKRVDLGQYLTPGTPVAEIYATEVVAIPLPLNDSQLGALGLPLYANAELGRTAVLSAQFGGQEWQWQAEIRRVEAVVDRQSRVVNAIAEVRNPFQPDNSGRPPLTPGMFVQAEIPTPPVAGLVRLPATALRSDDTVLVVDSGDRLVRQPVEVRRRSVAWAWVAGLPQGARVVREQSGLLVAGLSVQVATSSVAMGDQ